MEARPETMLSRMYCDSSWELRYSWRAPMPRITLIMRFERIISSINWLVIRLEPTQISV